MTLLNVSGYCQTKVYAFLATAKSKVTVAFGCPASSLAARDVFNMCLTVEFSLIDTLSGDMNFTFIDSLLSSASPDSVSSFKSKLSQHKWNTELISGDIFGGKTDLDAVTALQIAVSSSQFHCPIVGMSVTEPVQHSLNFSISS